MKLFCVASNVKQAGKTHFSAIALSSFLSTGKMVSYYKPFIMNAIGGKLFDTEYIKRKTNMEVRDIYTTFATPSNISPINFTENVIDSLEIIETIEEMKSEYNICLLETIGLYDPINKNETQTDLLYAIQEKIEDMSAIVVSAYDKNVVSNTLMLIEAMHLRKIKTSLVVINQIKDCIIDDNIIEYLNGQISPIKLHLLPFDNSSPREKFDYNEYCNLLPILENI